MINWSGRPEDGSDHASCVDLGGPAILRRRDRVRYVGRYKGRLTRLDTCLTVDRSVMYIARRYRIADIDIVAGQIQDDA